MYNPCLVSAPFFFLVSLISYTSLSRTMASLCVTTSTILYHTCPENNNYFLIDQIVILLCAPIIWSHDYCLAVSTLVCFSIVIHALYRPLSSEKHCVFVHIPVLTAMMLQNVSKSVGV